MGIFEQLARAAIRKGVNAAFAKPQNEPEWPARLTRFLERAWQNEVEAARKSKAALTRKTRD